MFNRNVFSTGLGTGLIAGSLLLQLMLSVAPNKGTDSLQPPSITSAEWDVDKVKALAEQHNYILYPKSEKRYTEAQLNDEIKQARQESAQKPAPSPSPSDSGAVFVYISEGNTSDEVAELLAKAGIIPDVSAFEAKVRNLGVDTKLNRGPFLLSPGMSEDDLLAKLVLHSS